MSLKEIEKDETLWFYSEFFNFSYLYCKNDKLTEMKYKLKYYQKANP